MKKIGRDICLKIVVLFSRFLISWFFFLLCCHLASKSVNLDEKRKPLLHSFTYPSALLHNRISCYLSFSSLEKTNWLRSNFTPSLQPDKKERNNKERTISAHNAHTSLTGRKKASVFTSSHVTKIDQTNILHRIDWKHIDKFQLIQHILNERQSANMFQNIKVQLERMGSNNTDEESVYQQLYDDESTHAPEGRVLYLSRHGESEYNLYGKIGVSISLVLNSEKVFFLTKTLTF